jgi:hypothetical protein
MEALNPLIRSLLTWELVARVEQPDGSHSWELAAPAQQRLDEITQVRRRASASLAYLDHVCATCRQRRLTHLIDGHYVCESCQ